MNGIYQKGVAKNIHNNPVNALNMANIKCQGLSTVLKSGVSPTKHKKPQQKNSKKLTFLPTDKFNHTGSKVKDIPNMVNVNK